MDIVQTTTGLIAVSLSRQNLEGLLQQLDEGATEAQIIRLTERGRLVVVAQEDDVHYGDRTPGRSGPSYDVGPPLRAEAQTQGDPEYGLIS